MEQSQETPSKNSENSSSNEETQIVPTNQNLESDNLENTSTTTKSDEGYKTDSLLFHFLCVFGVFFLTFFFVFNVYLTPITVVGQSMLPTINEQTVGDSDTSHNDIVYYRLKDSYTYGDIVIISNSSNQYITTSNHVKKVDYLIKRIVACPGDTITFFLTDISDDGNYYYYDIIVKDNTGKTVVSNENYIKEQMYFYKNYTYNGYYSNIAPNILNDSLPIEQRQSTITINENCYFAMGDNRNNSSDSRFFGQVQQSDIVGNVRLQIKYGENIWIAIFKKIKSFLSNTYIQLKENLWRKTY